MDPIKGLVGVLILLPPHLGQRYLSVVVCCTEVSTEIDPGFVTRRGWKR